MSSWLYTVSVGVTVVLLAGGVSLFLKRVTKRSKPRFSRDTGTSARATLIRAEGVFHQANATGGRLTHPWKIKDETFREHEIEDALKAICDEIADTTLSESIMAISKQIRKIWATEHKVETMVWSLDLPVPASQAAEWELIEKFASMQRDAASKGLVATAAAQLRLGKLSRNL